MGYGSEQVASCFFLFHFSPDLALLFHLRGEHSYYYRYQQHCGKCNRVACNTEIQLEVGICECVIYGEHSQQR